MPKLQINVSDEFAKFTEELVETCKKKQTEEASGLELVAPRSANQLIPLALVRVAKEIGHVVPQSAIDEAALILVRKPGPQKKKPVESHDLFDERPGTWLSNVAIATGCAMATCGEKSFSLSGCYVPSTAVVAALEAGWSAIPEVKETGNGPLPGIRFIPPGTDLAPKATPAPAPMALADVGAWVSEGSTLQRDQLVLADGRVIEYGDKSLPDGSVRVPMAIPTGDKPEQRHHAILKSIASAQSMAYQLGWTMRKETKNGSPGILLIPPRVKLTYEIAPGRTIPVTQ